LHAKGATSIHAPAGKWRTHLDDLRSLPIRWSLSALAIQSFEVIE